MARRTTKITRRTRNSKMVVRIRPSRRKTVTRVKYTQYRMTPARKAALRAAQLASARKRKGSGSGRSSRRPVRPSRPRSRQRPRISPRTRRNVRRAAVGAVVPGGVAAGTSPRAQRGVHAAHLAQARRRNNAAIRKRHVNRARADYAHMQALRARAGVQPGPPFRAKAARREARSTLAYGRRVAGRR